MSLIAEDVQDKLDTLELQRLDQVEAEARRLAGRALRSPMLRSLQLLSGQRGQRGQRPSGKTKRRISKARRTQRIPKVPLDLSERAPVPLAWLSG